MQKLLYPYLPEGMRNPQTFEWMMSNPEYRTQLEQMMEKQVCSAAGHLLKRKEQKSQKESSTKTSDMAVLRDPRGPADQIHRHHHSATTQQSH